MSADFIAVTFDVKKTDNGVCVTVSGSNLDRAAVLEAGASVILGGACGVSDALSKLAEELKALREESEAQAKAGHEILAAISQEFRSKTPAPDEVSPSGVVCLRSSQVLSPVQHERGTQSPFGSENPEQVTGATP